MGDPVGLDATMAMLRIDHPKGQKIKTNENFWLKGTQDTIASMYV